MSKMRVVQVPFPNAPFEIVERDIPEAAAGSVRIRVEACGVCHSDSLTKEGSFPGIQYPRVPGHEVVGVIDAVGSGVAGWKPGQRVGVGWHGGHCGTCDACRRGNCFACVTGRVTGVSHDGGYGEYMVAHASALALVPDELSNIEAAPLMCAGITTFNALRNSGAIPGDVVAVLGLGGLGHLGVQFAVKMGFKTVAIARGKDKEALARQLGASKYIDSKASDPAAALFKLGGAKIVLATVTSGEAMGAVLGAPRSEWNVPGLRSGWIVRRPAPFLADGTQIGQRLVFGHVDRFARHAGVQRSDGRAVDERSLPDGACERSLRSHDERRSPVSRRAEHGR